MLVNTPFVLNRMEMYYPANPFTLRPAIFYVIPGRRFGKESCLGASAIANQILVGRACQKSAGNVLTWRFAAADVELKERQGTEIESARRAVVQVVVQQESIDRM